MPLDTLLTTLARDAEAEASRRLLAAPEEAGRIAAESAARRAARRAAAVTARERELRQRAEVVRVAAEREGRTAVLRARERLIARVLDAARAELPAALGDPRVAAAAMRQAGAALAAWPPDAAVTVRCTPALAPHLEMLARGRTRTTVEPDPGVAAGAVVVADDGSAEIDGTLDGLLAHERTALAIAIVAMADADAAPDAAPDAARTAGAA